MGQIGGMSGLVKVRSGKGECQLKARLGEDWVKVGTGEVQVRGMIGQVKDR